MALKRPFLIVALTAFAFCHYANAQWQNIGPSFAVLSITFAADGALYAGTEHGVYRRNPETLAWEARSAGLPDLSVPAIAADPQSTATLYAAHGNGVGRPAGLFKTTDGGLTWSSASAGINSSLLIFALAIDPANPAVLYAGTNSGGVMKSSDAAGHWTPMTTGLTSQLVVSLMIDPNNTGTVYAGTGDGVFKSTDGGLSWNSRNVGLRGDLMPYTAAGFAIDPTNTSTLFLASFVPGSLPGGGGVYKSTNAGDTWAPVNNGTLHPAPISAIALDPRAPATVYAAGQTGGAVKTTDAGASWSSLSAGLTYPALALVVDPAAAGTVYAATRGGIFQLGSGACTQSSNTLCLNNARFAVQVTWRVPGQGISGTGQAITMTSDTGAFWFFTSNNLELVIKVLDGRAFNNKFWVFYGPLTNVEYTITVTDTRSGVVKTYFNPQGQLASVADTAAF